MLLMTFSSEDFHWMKKKFAGFVFRTRKCRKNSGNVEKIQEVLIRSRGGRVTQMTCQQRSVTIGDYFTTDVSRKTRHYVHCIKWHLDTEHSGSVSVPLFLC